MRRILAGILLLALLTLAACAPAREEDPAPSDEPPQEEQHLTADVPEEKVAAGSRCGVGQRAAPGQRRFRAYQRRGG